MADNDAVVAQAARKAGFRLLPILLILYMVAFLDRVNIGYVKESFMRDTGLSEAAFALGAGAFFVGYGLLEIPSNLILLRVGARVWIARIMVSWGIAAAAMVFARNGLWFCSIRALLGVMEAGFFPGIIFFLAGWFPEGRRGPMMGVFYFGAPCAQIFGGPISGLLLELNGVGGLKGWQWVFLVEGLLAVGAGIWVAGNLTNRPSEASWLSPDERAALQAAMDEEDSAKAQVELAGAKRSLWAARIWRLGLIYCLIQMSVYGVSFYLPAQVSHLIGRQAGLLVGMVAAIPWVAALGGAFAIPRLAARPGWARLAAALSLGWAAVGIAFSASSNPVLGLTGLSLAAAGFIGVQPVFWTIPTGELGGARAAGGIALINSLGAAGGFLAPNLKALAERISGSAHAGLALLAVSTLVTAVLIFFAFEPRQPAVR